MKQFDVITIFPDIFQSYINESILKRAQKNKLIKIQTHNLRDVTTDKHKTVDDRPYSGGPGMILMVEPIYKTLKKIKKKKKRIVIMLSPAGRQFTQRDAERLANYDQLILLCGRYEGFDARVDDLVDEKISIGPYVLSGGELPAMVLIEAVSRNIKGVLGHVDATKEETFSGDLDVVEYPQYTRPENFKGKKVPEILLSGDHQKIANWKAQQSQKIKDKK